MNDKITYYHICDNDDEKGLQVIETTETRTKAKNVLIDLRVRNQRDNFIIIEMTEEALDL